MRGARKVRLGVTTWAMAAVALLAGGATADNVVLLTRGARSDCALVLPPDASASQRMAADELKTYLRRLTGVDVPEGGDAVRQIRIETLEDPALGEAGYEIAVTDTALVIRGSKAFGCLYGAYEVLERFGGVRWYSSWCEKVPRLERFEVPARTKFSERPAFEMRCPAWHDVIGDERFALRLRASKSRHLSAPKGFGGKDYRFGGGLGCAHTFARFINIAKYGKTHPEYFALRDGKRDTEKIGRGGHEPQPCLSNPDVLRIVTEGVKERIRRDPGASFYGVSQNDHQRYCQCPACAAIDREEGSHAGSVVRFVNAVAEEVEKEFPGVIIETLAYQYSRKPPKKTRLRHNVIPCLCTIELDFSRPISESPSPHNQRFVDDIRGWSVQTDQLYLWDYVTDFYHYPLPFANVRTLQGNLRFFRDNGVRMMYEQGDREGHHAGFAELKAWLLAKLMWNPDADFEALLDDFLGGYYGEGAAPFVRTYLDELHRRQREWTADPRNRMGCYQQANTPPYNDIAFLDLGDELWEKAERAVASDSGHSYNVRMGAFSHRYARLEWMRETQKHEDLKRNPKAVALVRRLLADIKSARGRVVIKEFKEQERLAQWHDLAGPEEDRHECRQEQGQRN